jgi:hypothetical protein
MNNLPNHMQFGHEPEGEMNLTIKDVIEIIEHEGFTKRDLMHPHIKFSVFNYHIEFDFHYDEKEEEYKITNLTCHEGKYPVSSVEIELIAEKCEEQLDMVKYHTDIFETVANTFKPE